jgi:hypothetical protein
MFVLLLRGNGVKVLQAAIRKLLKESVNHAFTDGGDPTERTETW